MSNRSSNRAVPWISGSAQLENFTSLPKRSLEIKTFLSMYKKLQHKLTKSNRKEVFEEIAQTMRDKGYNVTQEELFFRIKGLKDHYYRIRAKMRAGIIKETKWVHYDDMHRIVLTSKIDVDEPVSPVERPSSRPASREQHTPQPQVKEEPTPVRRSTRKRRPKRKYGQDSDDEDFKIEDFSDSMSFTGSESELSDDLDFDNPLDNIDFGSKFGANGGGGHGRDSTPKESKSDKPQMPELKPIPTTTGGGTNSALNGAPKSLAQTPKLMIKTMDGSNMIAIAPPKQPGAPPGPMKVLLVKPLTKPGAKILPAGHQAQRPLVIAAPPKPPTVSIPMSVLPKPASAVASSTPPAVTIKQEPLDDLPAVATPPLAPAKVKTPTMASTTAATATAAAKEDDDAAAMESAPVHECLSKLINIQKDLLDVDRQRLELSKQRLEVEKELKSGLQSLLSVLVKQESGGTGKREPKA